MTDLPKTRHSLLIRLQNSNNSQAWTEFLEVYEQAIYSFARRRGLQDADAWDATQQVLGAVEKKVASWQADDSLGSFRGWLFRVARNVAVDQIRSQARRALASGDTRIAQILAEVPEDQEQESTQFWNNYRRKLLLWAANKIKPDYQSTSWDAFWMTAVEGRKPEQVAEQLDLSVGSVYAARFRITKKIRSVVNRLDDRECPEEFTQYGLSKSALGDHNGIQE